MLTIMKCIVAVYRSFIVIGKISPGCFEKIKNVFTIIIIYYIIFSTELFNNTGYTFLIFFKRLIIKMCACNNAKLCEVIHRFYPQSLHTNYKHIGIIFQSRVREMVSVTN